MGIIPMGVILAAGSLWAQSGGYVQPNRPVVNPLTGQSMVVQAADLKEDVRDLQRQLKELSLRVELLEGQKVQLEQKLADAKPDTSGFISRQEMQLLEQRLRDYASAEDQNTKDLILNEIRSISAQRFSTNQPEALRTSAPVREPVESLIISDAEKSRYMREGVRHVVSRGDTLSGVARRYNSSVRAIRAVNNIVDPNRLFVGMELFVPTSIQ